MAPTFTPRPPAPAPTVPARQGLAPSFEALFRSLQPRLIARLRSCSATRTLQLADIEDVTQEVFLRAFESRAYDPQRGPAVAYFATAARNCGINLLRKAFRRERGLYDRAGQLAFDPPDPQPTAPERIEQEESAVRAQQIIDRTVAAAPRLPRRAWALFYDKGLSIAHIAHALHTPDGNVGRWLSQLRLAVRRELRAAGLWRVL